MQKAATFTPNNFTFPANSHQFLDGTQENPNPSSSIHTPFAPIKYANMNGMIPQMNSHRLNGRRCSAGPTLSALYESSNDHNLNMINNCSDISAGSATGNLIGGMVGARYNPSISSGPKYSLEMLIAALDCPSEGKPENQSQREAGVTPVQVSQHQIGNTRRYSTGYSNQEMQLQGEQWASQNTLYGSSSDILLGPWSSSRGYSENLEQRSTQSTHWEMGYQGTGINRNNNYAQTPSIYGHSPNSSSVHTIQNSNKNHGDASTTQEEDMTFDELKTFEMDNQSRMQQGQIGEQIVNDDIVSLDAGGIPSPPNSAFYSQQKNYTRALQNPIQQQQRHQYANNQSIYGQKTPPSTILRTPPPSGGMQSYAQKPDSMKLQSRKRSMPNGDSQLPMDINNGTGTISSTEQEMMMRKRSKSFDVAMILSNSGDMTSRSSGQYLAPSAFCDHATRISTHYPGQLAFDAQSASHGRAATTSFIAESKHVNRVLPDHMTYPMFDPQTMAIVANMEHPPPAQCGENIPSVPDLPEESDDFENRPRRQHARYAGDLYTPQWVRYTGQAKEGFCDTCSPGKWLQLKNSAFWYHKQFFHGISSVSGKTFLNPMEQRVIEQDVVEGLCHQCQQWIPISNSKRKNSVLWYRHAHKCHIYHKPKNAGGSKKLS